jgi:hypothetical protein
VGHEDEAGLRRLAFHFLECALLEELAPDFWAFLRSRLAAQALRQLTSCRAYHRSFIYLLAKRRLLFSVFVLADMVAGLEDDDILGDRFLRPSLGAEVSVQILGFFSQKLMPLGHIDDLASTNFLLVDFRRVFGY